MLPTPSTSHVDYRRIYEPAEDSFLFLDTLSAPAETAFLSSRFAGDASAPLVVEIGTGSGVVVGFVTAQARRILGTRSVLAAGVDVNGFACAATAETVRRAVADAAPSADDDQQEESPAGGSGLYLGSARADLCSALRPGSVDVLLFNPPYVPTPEAPRPGGLMEEGEEGEEGEGGAGAFERDSYLLELSYAGGRDGMETTDRLIEELPRVLSPRGCAYILLCKQNRPDEVRARILAFGPEWRVVKAGDSGKQAGWEKLQILRIWREEASSEGR